MSIKERKNDEFVPINNLNFADMKYTLDERKRPEIKVDGFSISLESVFPFLALGTTFGSSTVIERALSQLGLMIEFSEERIEEGLATIFFRTKLN